MTKLLIIAVLLLLATVIVLIKIDRKQSTKIKELQNEIEKEHRIEKQKDKINTSDDVTNFNNSLDLLQNYSERRN